MSEGIDVVTGGTDNHMVLVDLEGNGISGLNAEKALRASNVTLNRNAIPFDARPPWVTSGLRMGSAALTTRGLGVDEFRLVGEMLARVIKERAQTGAAFDLEANSVIQSVRAEVAELLASFPLYPELSGGACG